MSDSLKPGPLECFVHRGDRSNPHFGRVDAGDRHRADAGHRLESQLLRFFFGHHEDGRRATLTWELFPAVTEPPAGLNAGGSCERPSTEQSKRIPWSWRICTLRPASSRPQVGTISD